MAEPEFSATGVQIERWPRSLTRAGEVVIKDGRLELLTSYGSEIDSAPVRAVKAGRPWFSGRDATVATVNGRRYRLTMGRHDESTDGGDEPEAAARAGRFLEAVRRATSAGN